MRGFFGGFGVGFFDVERCGGGGDALAKLDFLFQLGEVVVGDAVVAGFLQGVFGPGEGERSQSPPAESVGGGLVFELGGFLIEADKVFLPVFEVGVLGLLGFFAGLFVGGDGVGVEFLADGELFDGAAVGFEIQLSALIGGEEGLQVFVVVSVEARGLAVDAIEDFFELFGVFLFLGFSGAGLALFGVGHFFANGGNALGDFDFGLAGGKAFVAGLGDGALALFGFGEVLVALF